MSVLFCFYYASGDDFPSSPEFRGGAQEMTGSHRLRVKNHQLIIRKT